MKRTISFLLSFLLLISLIPAASAEEGFRFTRENFPRMDGSTSMVPLGQAIASVLLGESREDASDLISFNRTTMSFHNLLDGWCDIVIAAEPSPEVFQMMRQAAFPYLMETIAKEALVFVINADNPVDSLTPQQLRDIYAGRITNWREVGGEDLPIAAFQRNPSAGSQVMMEKLVMDGTPMMPAPSTMIPSEMGQLIEAVRSYDHSANAIGYTVFYYASDMQMADGLKILRVNDVLPCAETIQAEQYPFLNGYYACIRADAPQSSPQRILFDWLVSSQGQQLLRLEGYVPAVGESAPDSGVVTDYSAYIPAKAVPAQFTLFDCAHDRLEPSGEYGQLYPYRGPRLYTEGDPEYGDYAAGSLYGFYTHSGQLVTEPVYRNLYRMEVGDDSVWVMWNDNNQCGFCSMDGQYVSQFCYDWITTVGNWILAVRDDEEGIFDLFDSDFHLVRTQEDFRRNGKSFIPDTYANGCFLASQCPYDWENPCYIVMNMDGQVLMESDQNMSMDGDGFLYIYQYDMYNNDDTTTVLDPSFNPVLFDDGRPVNYAYRLNSRFFSVRQGDRKWIADRNGSLLIDQINYGWQLPDDRFVVITDIGQTIYDSQGRAIWQNLPEQWQYLAGDVFYHTDYGQDSSTLTLHQISTGKSLTIGNGQLAFVCGEYIIVSYSQDGSWKSRIVDRNLNLLPEVYPEISTLWDIFTGGSCLMSNDSYGFQGQHQVYSSDGLVPMMSVDGDLEMQNGFITSTSDTCFRCFDPAGNLVFCYPYYGLSTGD